MDSTCRQIATEPRCANGQQSNKIAAIGVVADRFGDGGDVEILMTEKIDVRLDGFRAKRYTWWLVVQQ